MTDTTYFFDRELFRVGFEEEPGHDGWWFHISEPVRLVWDDPESRAFTLYRFHDVRRDTTGYYTGSLYGKVSGEGLHTDDFRDIVRAFLR